MNTDGGGKDIASSFWTPALDGSEWSASSPGRFTPRESVPGGPQSWSGRFRYPLDSRLGGPQSLSERYGEEKNLAPVGNEPRAF
jgi:hypothetical protein